MIPRGYISCAAFALLALACAPVATAQSPPSLPSALRRNTPSGAPAPVNNTAKGAVKNPAKDNVQAAAERPSRKSARPAAPPEDAPRAASLERPRSASNTHTVAPKSPPKPSPKSQSSSRAKTPSDSPPIRRVSAYAPAQDPLSDGPALLPSPTQEEDERLLQFDSRRPPEITLDMRGERIILSARSAPLADVVDAIAQQHGLNLVAGDEVSGVVTVSLRNVTLEEALRAVLLVNGYTWHQEGSILIVSELSPESRTPDAQRGAQVRVFELNFVSADDVDKVVQGLLSPAGKTFLTASQSSDKRKTREELVVQDLPEYIARIEQYIAQVDRPPRQVLVEAHILQVDLRDELRHGVNLGAIARVAGAEVSLRSTGLASSTNSPSLFFGIEGTDLDALLEAMRTLTDAKTLASPKVLVVNGQEAKLQVGGQLGYFMTTTTQTSSMQSVEFLDVGVVMTVTPVIADDGHVLMTVKPEVSKGRINSQTNLPEKDTTQTQTTLMLRSGQGMVIGGLIQETDTESLNKVPLLGDAPLVGRLFQRKVTEQRRQELIIAVVPRIVPLVDCAAEREQIELERAFTPLLHGPICPVDRSHLEPVIPGTREGRPIKQRECEEAECHPQREPQHCPPDSPGAVYVPAPELEQVRHPNSSGSARAASRPATGRVSAAPQSKPPVISNQNNAAAPRTIR